MSAFSFSWAYLFYVDGKPTIELRRNLDIHNLSAKDFRGEAEGYLVILEHGFMLKVKVEKSLVFAPLSTLYKGFLYAFMRTNFLYQ